MAEVQRLWMEGDRDAARARVPVAIGLRQNLIGPPEEIRRRLREYRDCGVSSLRLGSLGDTLDVQVDTLGQVMDLVREVNGEDS